MNTETGVSAAASLNCWEVSGDDAAKKCFESLLDQMKVKRQIREKKERQEFFNKIAGKSRRDCIGRRIRNNGHCICVKCRRLIPVEESIARGNARYCAECESVMKPYKPRPGHRVFDSGGGEE